MRSHEHGLYGGDYPRLVMPQNIQLMRYHDDTVCLGAGDYGVVVQGQSTTSKALYAIKYYVKGKFGITSS